METDLKKQKFLSLLLPLPHALSLSVRLVECTTYLPSLNPKSSNFSQNSDLLLDNLTMSPRGPFTYSESRSLSNHKDELQQRPCASGSGAYCWPGLCLMGAEVTQTDPPTHKTPGRKGPGFSSQKQIRQEGVKEQAHSLDKLTAFLAPSLVKRSRMLPKTHQLS